MEQSLSREANSRSSSRNIYVTLRFIIVFIEARQFTLSRAILIQ
jgi:hypothetical protein